MPDIRPEDMQAGVEAGIVTESQAASLAALAQKRAGLRESLAAEDEPFEFFRGFAEIFISLGLIVLFLGVLILFRQIDHKAANIIIPGIAAVSCWFMGRYFTIKRRMNLPSMILVVVFASGIFTSVTIIGEYIAIVMQSNPGKEIFILAGLATTVSAAIWYRCYLLPFSMFVLGLCLFATIMAILIPDFSGKFSDIRTYADDVKLATLIIGALSFVAAMWFDMKDPHRISRYSATGFWLHLLAATALVNTIISYIWEEGGNPVSVLLVALALLIFTLVALIIDRRSVVTAGSIYFIVVLGWLIEKSELSRLENASIIAILFGLMFVILGTWWVQIRAGLMQRLPDFPGKERLPPYRRS